MGKPDLTDQSPGTATVDETAVEDLRARQGRGRPRVKSWRLYGRRLLRRPAALVGTVIFCMFLFLAVFGPWVAPYEPGATTERDLHRKVD